MKLIILCYLILINSIFSLCGNNKIESNKIPRIPGIFIDGAAAEEGKVDIDNSPYYKDIDFYNGWPTKTLIKLEKFKTYQQTREWSCGACCALMALNYLGVTDVSEQSLIKEMDVRSADNPRDDGSFGATTKSIVDVFKNRGFDVISSMETQKEDGKTFESEKEFYKFVKKRLQEGSVILVENVEFAGHWRVIIGYDDMGNTEDTATHVIVFADPYDTTDHKQDGYTIGSVDRFFAAWFDHDILPLNQRQQQYICVSKKVNENNKK